VNAIAESAAIDGVSNFRDFGGLTAGGNARVVAGRLYRSANPARVTDEGVAQLTRLGIATIVDLRGTAERAKALADFGAVPIAIRATPIEPKTSVRLREMLTVPGTRAGQIRDLMIASYRGYVNEAAVDFGAAFQAILAESEGPLLVHCTAGKDRTGFVVAVLQAALAVPRDAIFEDYLATNRHWDRASAAGHVPMESDAVEPVLVADADYLAAAFEEIEKRDGDVRAFLHRATAGRVTQSHLDALIERSA
jgi:protein-tyrosine phosphatase